MKTATPVGQRVASPSRSAADRSRVVQKKAATPKGPADRRSVTLQFAQLASLANPPSSASVQLASVGTNSTGLPGALKAGIEHLSGHSLDHVRVHRNSPKPAQLHAHAFAQGSDIHVAPGQEKHLPHEAWHVVQQAQGRVKPTLQAKGVAINDDAALEKEADVMGARALTQRRAKTPPTKSSSVTSAAAVAQLTPADWVASPRIATIEAIASGWFSTAWKQIKAEIVIYKALAAANTAARTASLNEMTRLIALWRANPKHPANSTSARIHSIHANLPALEGLIAEEHAEIAATALDAVGGLSHSLVRHGPDLTDAQLQNRLTTGLDRAGHAAPADASSRFNSYQAWIRTRTAAANLANAAKVATLAALNPTMTAFNVAWAAARALPGGPGKPAAIAAALALRPAIHAAAAAIAVPSPNLLPVDIINPNNPPAPVFATAAAMAANPVAAAAVNAAAVAANNAAVATAVQNMPRLRARYAITILHPGFGVGPSFAGTGPAGGPHPGAVAGPLQRSTTTVFAPVVGPLTAAAPAAGWGLITHFPSSDPAGIT